MRGWFRLKRIPESFNFENAYLVDRRGILLKTKSLAPEYLGLPLIIGVDTSNCQAGQPLEQDEVKAALDLIRASAEILQGRFQIQSIDVSKGYCLIVTDKQQANITFSTDEIECAAAPAGNGAELLRQK